MEISAEENQVQAELSTGPKVKPLASECEDKPSRCTFACCLASLDSNQFPLLILLSIIVAKAYPRGGDILQADITATWIAVILIFLISGLCLRWEELAKACKSIYFNVFVQAFNFGFVSISTLGFSRFMVKVGAINSALADGMVICSCLPMAINVVIVLTSAAGGDEAAAIFNTTLGNIIGIFLSPALILLYLGTSGDVTMAEVFYKLTIRVIVPLVIGFGVRIFSQQIALVVTTHKKKLKRVQEYALVFIVYTVFCQTFQDGTDAQVGDIVLTVFFQLFLLLTFMAISWTMAGNLSFANDPKLRVMALFGCSGKTISLGVPLINSIYETDPQKGLYTLPLLIWHPLQLLIGSYLTSKLAKSIKSGETSAGSNSDSAPSSTDVSLANPDLEQAEDTERSPEDHA